MVALTWSNPGQRASRWPSTRRRLLASIVLGISTLGPIVVAPPAVLAGGVGTISVSPATRTVATGSTFAVDLVAKADIPISGVAAVLTFDRARLQVVSMTRAGPWATDGAVYIGYPTDANMTAAIAADNASGRVTSYPATAGAIGVAFVDGSTSEPADTALPFLTVTFRATACGTTTLGLPVGPTSASMLDGRPPMPSDGYGYPVALTLLAGAVVDECPGPSPTPTPTAGATSTPSPSPTPIAPSASGVTTITGTLAESQLGLSVPATASIPLNWDTTNEGWVLVQITSNRAWSLSVRDAKGGSDQGHMTSDGGRLAAPMSVASSLGPVDLEKGGPCATGGSRDGSLPHIVLAGLLQPVGQGDQPATYRISLVFTVTATF